MTPLAEAKRALYLEVYEQALTKHPDVIRARQDAEAAVMGTSDSDLLAAHRKRQRDPGTRWSRYDEAGQAEPRRPWDVLLNEWLTVPAGDVDPRVELRDKAERLAAMSQIPFLVALEEAKTDSRELVERIAHFNRQL